MAAYQIIAQRAPSTFHRLSWAKVSAFWSEANSVERMQIDSSNA